MRQKFLDAFGIEDRFHELFRIIDVDKWLPAAKNVRACCLFWWRRLGRSRILQVVFANERAGNIHALGNIENRYLTTINDQRDTTSSVITILGLVELALLRPELIL